MRRFILKILAMISPLALAQQSIVPVPKDPFNTPIYGSSGYPSLYEVALTTSSYALIATLPTTGINQGRSWRHIMVRNPSTTRTVYVCLGDATSCATDMIKVPPEFGIAMDDMLLNAGINITSIWGRLDSAGSVTPEVHVW